MAKTIAEMFPVLKHFRVQGLYCLWDFSSHLCEHLIIFISGRGSEGSNLQCKSAFQLMERLYSKLTRARTALSLMPENTNSPLPAFEHLYFKHKYIYLELSPTDAVSTQGHQCIQQQFFFCVRFRQCTSTFNCIPPMYS